MLSHPLPKHLRNPYKYILAMDRGESGLIASYPVESLASEPRDCGLHQMCLGELVETF